MKSDSLESNLAHSVEGRITPDPLSEMLEGSTVEMRPVRLLPTSETRSCALSDWHTPEGILLSIHFREDNGVHVAGSAVIVAPGVALSAKHIFESRREGLQSGAIGVICFGICSSGALLWKIRRVAEVSDSDLVILCIELASAPPQNNIFNFATISLRPTRTGEKVCILGFRASSSHFEFGNGLPIRGQVIQSQGTVLQRFDSGRDSCFLPWPSIEVDCPTWGGMSGGPVFDGQGRLVGLVTSSFSFETGEEPSPTFVSQIWPALVTPFEACWPAGIYERAAAMMDLDPRLCEIDDRGRLIRETESGSKIWRYATTDEG